MPPFKSLLLTSSAHFVVVTASGTMMTFLQHVRSVFIDFIHFLNEFLVGLTIYMLKIILACEILMWNYLGDSKLLLPIYYVGATHVLESSTSCEGDLFSQSVLSLVILSVWDLCHLHHCWSAFFYPHWLSSTWLSLFFTADILPFSVPDSCLLINNGLCSCSHLFDRSFTQSSTQLRLVVLTVKTSC